MPMLAQAQLLVSVNGGPWQSGGLLNVPAGVAIAIKAGSSFGVTSYVWEIYDYPPAFACPAGWLSVAGVYTSFSTVPMAFSLPALAVESWGKFGLRLRINGNPLEFNQDGSLNPAYTAQWTDESTMLSVASPNMAMEGIAFNESIQYDAFRSYVGALMQMFRAIDAAHGSSLSGVVPIGFAVGESTAESTTGMVSGGLVTRTSILVKSAYPSGTRIQVGYAGATNAFMDSADGDLDPTVVGTPYSNFPLLVLPSTQPLLVTVSGPGGSGTSYVYAEYSVPNS